MNSHQSINSLLVTNDTFLSGTNVAGQVKCDSLETGNITDTSLILNANQGLICLTANSLAVFESMHIDTELMCLANDIYFGRGLIHDPGILRNRFFLTPNNYAEWIGMRFGLEEDYNGEKVARMRLDNSALGEINKYIIMIGTVSAMNIFTGGAIIEKCQIGNNDFGNMMSLSLQGN